MQGVPWSGKAALDKFLTFERSIRQEFISRIKGCLQKQLLAEPYLAGRHSLPSKIQ
jgi:hypothetical protein